MRYTDKNGNSWSYTNGWRLILLPLVAFLCLVGCAFGQVYPPEINLDDVETENYTPPNEVPQYLQPTTNRYGNIVTRISDVGVFGVNSQQLAHNYSKDQVWNVDGTLMKLASKPAAILDGETYEFLYWAENIVGYAQWSNQDNDLIYGVSGNQFMGYRPSTDTRFVIRTFNEFSRISISVDYEFRRDVDLGYGEGKISHDDRYVGLIGNNNTFIVYDILNDTYVSIPKPSGDLDWFTVTPSGRYAVAQWRGDGNGINQGMKLYNIDLTNERHIADYTGHGDFLQLSNGQEVFIQFGNQPQWDNQCSLEMINLDTEVSTNVFFWSFAIHGNSGIWGGHISTTYNVKDWVFISEGCCYNHGTLPSENFAYNPLTNEIRRYGKNHSRAQVGYTHEARGSVNRDGTKMIYASNYFKPEIESLNSALAFVVEVPQPTLSIEEFATVEYPYCVEYFGIEGKSVLTHEVDDMFDEFDVKIELENLPNGIYIEIKTYENRVERRKIVK